MGLPNNWVESTLGYVCNINMGQSPSSDTYNNKGDGLPFYQGKTDFGTCYPVARMYCNAPKKTAQKDDILMSVRAPVGSVNIATEMCCIGRGLSALSPRSGVMDYKFIFYYCHLIEKDLDKLGVGSTFRSINKNKLESFPIPLPPLAEQHRIVAKIEELFAELDRGIAGLEKAKAQLKTYRQAVLHDIFEKTEPDDIVYLGTLIEKPRYGSAKKCISERNQGALPVYRIPNIDYASGKINQDDLKYAVFDDNEINVLKLKENDILIIRSNGSVSLVGRAAIITDDDILGLFAGYLMRIRINDSTIVSPKYLLYCLQTPIIRNYIENTAKSTSGVNNINSGEIMRIQIPLFPIDNQYQIVSEIETRLSFCDSLEKTIDSSLKNADLLRMSILKKAFAGELVGQDPADAPSPVLSKENT